MLNYKNNCLYIKLHETFVTIFGNSNMENGPSKILYINTNEF